MGVWALFSILLGLCGVPEGWAIAIPPIIATVVVCLIALVANAESEHKIDEQKKQENERLKERKKKFRDVTFQYIDQSVRHGNAWIWDCYAEVDEIDLTGRRAILLYDKDDRLVGYAGATFDDALMEEIRTFGKVPIVRGRRDYLSTDIIYVTLDLNR